MHCSFQAVLTPHPLPARHPLTVGFFRSRPFSGAALSPKQVEREEGIGATIGSLVASAAELRFLFAVGLFGDAAALPIWDSGGWMWAVATHVLLVRPHLTQAFLLVAWAPSCLGCRAGAEGCGRLPHTFYW
jgi:hypothetical protein